MKQHWVFVTIEIVAEDIEAVKKEVASILKSDDRPLTWTIDNIIEVEKTG